MAADIPQEILIEILRRLPVRSLLKFRCVCKCWYSLIANPDFINAHIKFSIQSNKTQSFSLVKQKYLPGYEDQIVLYNDNDVDQSSKGYQELEFPFERLRYFEIIGSCNGLVCLSDARYVCFYIWNPVIGKYLGIVANYCSSVVGFGFDSNKKDYKLVKILHCPKKLEPLEVKIFELSSSSWRSISVANNKFVDFTTGDKRRAYLNGSIHWVAHVLVPEGSSKKLALASFDLANEVFRELRIPDALSEVHENHLSLAVCGQSLALIQYLSWQSDDFSWSYGYYESCCIWVLNEYGVHQSWSRRFNLNFQHYGGLVRVLSFQRNGKILLQIRSSELVTYDSQTQKIVYHGRDIRRSCYAVHDYMESLVLLPMRL